MTSLQKDDINQDDRGNNSSAVDTMADRYNGLTGENKTGLRSGN